MLKYGLTETEIQERDLIARLAAQKEVNQKKELTEQIAYCQKQFKEIQKEWNK